MTYKWFFDISSFRAFLVLNYSVLVWKMLGVSFYIPDLVKGSLGSDGALSMNILLSPLQPVLQWSQMQMWSCYSFAPNAAMASTVLRTSPSQALLLAIVCSPQSPSSLPATPTFSYLLRRAQLPPSLSRQFMLAPPPVGCISPPLHLVISGLDLMSELTAVLLLLNYHAMWFHDSGKFFFKTLVAIFITHLQSYSIISVPY